MITKEDLSFVRDEGERAAYLKYLNEGTIAATHCAPNNGGWETPPPNKKIIETLTQGLLSKRKA